MTRPATSISSSVMQRESPALRCALNALSPLKARPQPPHSPPEQIQRATCQSHLCTTLTLAQLRLTKEIAGRRRDADPTRFLSSARPSSLACVRPAYVPHGLITLKQVCYKWQASARQARVRGTSAIGPA